MVIFFFSSRRRHTRWPRDWSSDVCSSDLAVLGKATPALATGFSFPDNEPWTPRPSDLQQGKIFRHGVASGDPHHHSVVLWTRVTPKHDGIVAVECHVATDPSMRRVIARHIEFTSSQRDFTVKFEAHGLIPGQTYYYRFVAL